MQGGACNPILRRSLCQTGEVHNLQRYLSSKINGTMCPHRSSTCELNGGNDEQDRDRTQP